MATSKERTNERRKGQVAMKTPPIVSSQEWGAAHRQILRRRRPSPAPVMLWPPNADGCHGRRWPRAPAALFQNFVHLSQSAGFRA